MKKDKLEEYLLHSYKYYVLSDPVISDADFDALCEEINKEWDYLDSKYKAFLIEKKNTPPIKGLELLEDAYPEAIRIKASFH